MPIELESALQQLRQRLDERLSAFERHPPPFGNPEPMRRVVKQIEQCVDREGQITSCDRIQEALTLLYTQGLQSALIGHLRYLCWGLLAEWGRSKRRLLHEANEFPVVLAELERISVKASLSLSAWRGLLQAYFRFDFTSKDKVAQANWQYLRRFLARTLPAIVARTRFRPTWLEAISAHTNLLSEQPCDRYGAAALAGEESEINFLREALQIPPSSWFWSELLLTQIKVVIKRHDAEFRAGFKPLLGLVQKFHKDSGICNQALILLLNRYGASEFRNTVHPELRDFALTTWGTPHLENNARWGQVNPAAKAMVRSWLVVEAIRDFFTILRDVTSSIDEARLNFWLRYQSVIEYFHFVLGPHVKSSRQTDYTNFCKKFSEHIGRLISPGNANNNAFIFKIGDYTLVEFSSKGNAFYCYHKDQIPFQLMAGHDLSLYQLKVSSDATVRLTHRASWESEFERELGGLGIFPERIDQLASASDSLPCRYHLSPAERRFLSG